MAQLKTNAMRMLEKEKVVYQVHEYPYKDGAIDGEAVAKKLGQAPDCVFKTLVTQGVDKNYVVFVIPVTQELNLKKAAKAAGVKNVAMIPVSKINQVTGYIRGGCSPIGMKKEYATWLEESAVSKEKILVSAGKIGYQIELSPQDLIYITHAQTANLV